MSDMFTEHTRRPTKARKPHVCAECKGMIDAGSTYIRNGQKLGNEMSTVARHVDCLAAADSCENGLMTQHGFRMFLHAGLRLRPELWNDVQSRFEADFPRVVARLKLSGVIK